jgi:hypothetical protein
MEIQQSETTPSSFSLLPTKNHLFVAVDFPLWNVSLRCLSACCQRLVGRFAEFSVISYEGAHPTRLNQPTQQQSRSISSINLSSSPTARNHGARHWRRRRRRTGERPRTGSWYDIVSVLVALCSAHRTRFSKNLSSSSCSRSLAFAGLGKGRAKGRARGDGRGGSSSSSSSSGGKHGHYR